MKVLIIGGNRFFGKRLTSGLLARGIEVTLLNRGQIDDGFGDRIARIKMDRRDLKEGHPAVEGKSWDIVFDQVCYDANEAGGACRAFNGKIGKYVFTSSESVYDPAPALSEAAFDPYAHRFDRVVTREGSYEEAKRQAEAAFFAQATFPVTAVRFPFVVGPDDYTGRFKFHVDHVRDGKPMFFPNVNAKCSFIHSADAAAFLESLIDRDIPGPINCCAPEPIVLRSLLAEIEKAVGKSATLVPSESEGDASPYGIERDWYMDIAKLRSLGPVPTPIGQWLQRLIKEVSSAP